MAKIKQRKTNVQLVTQMMNYSAYGALAQAFIINAISAAADVTAQTDPAGYPPNDMFSPEAWIGVAREIQASFKEHHAS